MSRRQRARITRCGWGEGSPPAFSHMPEGATEHGRVRRGDEDGWLLQLRSGRYALMRDDGGLAVLDQDKVAAMLAAEQAA